MYISSSASVLARKYLALTLLTRKRRFRDSSDHFFAVANVLQIRSTTSLHSSENLSTKIYLLPSLFYSRQANRLFFIICLSQSNEYIHGPAETKNLIHLFSITDALLDPGRASCRSQERELLHIMITTSKGSQPLHQR